MAKINTPKEIYIKNKIRARAKSFTSYQNRQHHKIELAQIYMPSINANGLY